MSKNNLRAPKPHNKRSDRVYSKDARIVHDAPEEAVNTQSYIDKTKIFHQNIDKAIRERVRRIHKTIELPESIKSIVTPSVSDVLVINYSGRQRELLPDIPPRHVMLCHHSMARVMESGVGIFVRITNADDGSWALTPCNIKMINQTTVQHVRRRPLWFLRRYGYEISFDGRVEPAMMLFNYNLSPERTKQRFYVTYEKVEIRTKKEDTKPHDTTKKFNSFFRFWRDKKNINQITSSNP